ncbi:MAG: hypothetical protein GWM88_05475 [Pseudomonadales bacterium]|nr:hypothetical protein [Pseudomonadales bacterium]NIX07485.1 hypothetical protein [Pseudomonadales bacterium]
MDFLALLLLVGLGVMASGVVMDPPGSPRELFLIHFGDWTPGLIIDGVLLDTLDETLGDALTSETREAQASAFGLIASVMREA